MISPIERPTFSPAEESSSEELVMVISSRKTATPCIGS